jgi:hypothetical protein
MTYFKEKIFHLSEGPFFKFFLLKNQKINKNTSSKTEQFSKILSKSLDPTVHLWAAIIRKFVFLAAATASQHRQL